jgi:hypothetical protein
VLTATVATPTTAATATATVAAATVVDTVSKHNGNSSGSSSGDSSDSEHSDSSGEVVDNSSRNKVLLQRKSLQDRLQRVGANTVNRDPPEIEVRTSNNC